MRIIFFLLCIAFVDCVGGNNLYAQESSLWGKKGSQAFDEPPQTGILDKAGFFRRYPKQATLLGKHIRDLSEKYAYPLYVVVEYVVYDGELGHRAREYFNHWIGEENRGMVVLYQVDPVPQGTQNPAFAYFEGTALPEEGKDVIDGRIDGLEMARMVRNILDEIPEEKQGAQRLTSFALGLEKQLEAYYAVEPIHWSNAQNLWFIGVFSAIVILAACLLIMLWKRLLGREKRINISYYLPLVGVKQRLKAPYGGVLHSEINSAQQPASK